MSPFSEYAGDDIISEGHLYTGVSNVMSGTSSAGRSNSRFEWYGATALTRAGNKGHAYVVEILMDNGADPTIRDNTLNSPPAIAKAKGKSKIVDRWIKQGAK